MRYSIASSSSSSLLLVVLLLGAVDGSNAVIQRGAAAAAATPVPPSSAASCWGCRYLHTLRGGSSDETEAADDEESTAPTKASKIPSGGASDSKYATKLELVKEQVVAAAMPEVSEYYYRWHEIP
jgi:hypothetical protein